MIKRHFILAGRDFPTDDAITAEKQVDLLVKQATSHENLCQCYIGWFVSYCFRPQGKVMFPQACVILSTIGLMATGSLRRGSYASYWDAFLLTVYYY